MVISVFGVAAYLMQQDGQRVQEVVIAPLKYMHHTDQAATHVAAHLHLHCTIIFPLLGHVSIGLEGGHWA